MKDRSNTYLLHGEFSLLLIYYFSFLNDFASHEHYCRQMVSCDKNVNHAPFYTASLGLELTDSYSKRFFMNLKKYLEIPKTNKIITSLKHTELMLKQNSLPKSTASLNQQGTNNSCHPSGPNLAPRLSYRTSSSPRQCWRPAGKSGDILSIKSEIHHHTWDSYIATKKI